MAEVQASVIVCVYNRGAEVLHCLDSILSSDFDDCEIVLVDDASTDDTPSRLAVFAESHPDRRVTIVRNKRNLGVSGARNAGIAAAKGHVVVFTDSDCTVDPAWLRLLTSAFENESITAAGGTVLNPQPTNMAERAYVGRSKIQRTSWQGRKLVGCNMAFRRDIIATLGFDSALSYYCDEDDLARRLDAIRCEFAFVPDAVVHHHHRLDLRGYLRMGYRQGIGSARLWYKHGIYVGRDVWAGIAGAVTLPLVAIDPRLSLIPAALVLLQLGAIAFNEIALKGKGIVETAIVLPLAVLYYVYKSCGVVMTWLRLTSGGEKAIRESKRGWLHTRRDAAEISTATVRQRPNAPER